MTESPCSAFEASSRSPSFLICLLSHLSIYLYEFSVCFFACLVLYRLIACYYFTFLFSLSPDALILSLSLSTCFLLLQSFIYSASRAFSSQPGLLLTDSVWFYNAHARKSSSVQPPNYCNKLWPCLSASLPPSFDVYSAHVNVCAHATLHYTDWKKKKHFVAQFLTHS